MHVNGKAERSCVMPVSSVDGATITTIEGLAAGGVLTPVQQAWLDLQVPQCGYCQSGMIMAVSALLAEKPHATDAEVDAAITNICRCGTFARIRSAIHTPRPPPAKEARNGQMDTARLHRHRRARRRRLRARRDRRGASRRAVTASARMMRKPPAS